MDDDGAKLVFIIQTLIKLSESLNNHQKPPVNAGFSDWGGREVVS